MFINKDLLEFFGSMMEIKMQKRDVFNTLAAEVDDPTVKATLLSIGNDEQRDVAHLQLSMDLVNGLPYYASTLHAHTSVPQPSVYPNMTADKADVDQLQNEVDLFDRNKPLPFLHPLHNKAVADVQPHLDQIQPTIEPVEVRPELTSVEEVPHTAVDEALPDTMNPVKEELSGGSAQPIPSQTILAVLGIAEQGGIAQKRPLFETISAIRVHPGFSNTTLPSESGDKQRLMDQTQLTIGLIKKVQSMDSPTQFQPTPSQTFNSMDTFKHPLAEVFGFTTTDQSSKAQRYRSHRHCPFNNKVPNCTKGQTKNPLGVCSILHNNKPVVTCPVRFREDWLITDDAASFFFEEGVRWSSLTEVNLTDAYGKSAGEIDVVLVAYDEYGKMVDFGAIEIQAAFISGDARDPFDFYMKDTKSNSLMDWTAQSNYPQPDFLSAARESLVPQLIFKGSILNSWHKKMAVAINKSYFDTLPDLIPVQKEEADIAWLIYDLELVVDGEKEKYQLQKSEVVYTKYQQTLAALTASYPDNLEHFLKLLPELADK
jgi:hypothetical protein